jgi:hypothetical protein
MSIRPAYHGVTTKLQHFLWTCLSVRFAFVSVVVSGDFVDDPASLFLRQPRKAKKLQKLSPSWQDGFLKTL